jgi:hypothetical protein
MDWLPKREGARWLLFIGCLVAPPIALIDYGTTISLFVLPRKNDFRVVSQPKKPTWRQWRRHRAEAAR